MPFPGGASAFADRDTAVILCRLRVQPPSLGPVREAEVGRDVAGDTGACLVPFVWGVAVMASMGWLLPVQHPLCQDAAEWSPSVMFTLPALKSLLTSLTT